ncbi:hypothetical protein HID58_027062, partial [Brassica napus]
MDFMFELLHARDSIRSVIASLRWRLRPSPAEIRELPSMETMSSSTLAHSRLFAQQIPPDELYSAIVVLLLNTISRAATLNMTQRIVRKALRSFEENVMLLLTETGDDLKNEMDIGDALLVSELVEHLFKVNHPYFYLTYQ